MMKINFRTVKQQKFEVNIDGNETVAKLKEEIEKQEKFDKSTITLIFAGKFMDDSKLVKEYSITEKDFVVLTIKPTKNPNPPKVISNSPPQTTTTSQNTTSQNTTTTSQNTTQQQQTTQQQTTQQQQTQNTPEPSEDAINSLIAMGFPRDEAIRALKIGGNNPSIAVEILMGGVGGDNWEEGEGGEGVDDTQEGGNVFATLRNHPLFVQMRALVQANPQYLEELLGNIANQSPQLFQVIQQHQDQFVQFLNEPVTQEQLQQALAAGLGLQGQGGQGGVQIPRGQGIPRQGGGLVQPQGGQGGQGQPRRVEVQLTQEENEAVNNLVGMGFNRDKVLHYYILFEKDQEMTANYLLNHGFDDEQQDQ